MKPQNGRLVALVVSVVAVAMVCACSSGGDGGPTGNTSLPPQSTDSSSAPSTTTTSSPSPTPTRRSVPVDQIPPGNPSSWIPAGVPTTAKYAQSGQKPPRFTPAVFQHTSAGARAMFDYYLTAQQWAFAALDPRPVTIVCSASPCTVLSNTINQLRSRQQHVVGQVPTYSVKEILPAQDSSVAELVRRARSVIAPGSIVDSGGRSVQSFKQIRTTIEVYLKWDGIMWFVAGQGNI